MALTTEQLGSVVTHNIVSDFMVEFSVGFGRRANGRQ